MKALKYLLLAAVLAGTACSDEGSTSKPVVNPDGGGLSSNHPGMRGIFLVIEAVKQLRGECDARQVDGARLACVHGTGGTLGVAHSGATLILGLDA